jgi:hypothetical protein
MQNPIATESVRTGVDRRHRRAVNLDNLFDSMKSALAQAGADRDTDTLGKLYDRTPATNFSSDVLAARPEALNVLRAERLGWSDLGEPARVLSVINPKRVLTEPVPSFLRRISPPSLRTFT